MIGVIAAYVATSLLLTGVGSAIVRWWDSSRFGAWEADVIEWFARHRTDIWTTVANVGSGFSDTRIVVGLGVLALPVFIILFRRWHDYVLVFGAAALQGLVYLTASTVVDRDRPPVERLGGAPTASFPSGHIGAATALYGGLFVVVVMHTHSRRIRLAAGTFAGLAVCSVTLSRFYLGMHYPSDALGGLASGLIALLTFRWAVHRTLAGSTLPGRAAVDCPARNSASPESEQSNSSTRRETQHVR